MVQKAVRHIAAEAKWDEARAAALYESKVLPSMGYNRRIGNSYTASLWIAVADVLREAKAGGRIGAYSYGSGFGSEFLQLRATGVDAHWHAALEADFAAREELRAGEYDTWRKSAA